MKPVLRTVLYFLAAVVATAAVTAAITISAMNNAHGERVVMTREEYEQIAHWAALEELAQRVDAEYCGDPVSREDMRTGAVRGALQTLNDPYSCYYTEEEYLTHLDQVNGTYKGIGVVLSQPGANGTQILKVYEDSPAAAAGILPGDILLAVNGVSVIDRELEEVRSMFSGEVGSAITVQLQRGEETLSVEVVLDQVTVQYVTHALFNQSTGYIRLDQFRGECVEEFRDALLDLKERGMRSLVVDLRNNPGGTLESAVDIADLLLDDCVVVTVRQKNGEEKVYRSAKNTGNVPLAILVNENSASASEILAGAVQDNQAGIIVGKTTYGKGVVQTTKNLASTGGWVKLTTAKYYTPSGQNIHGVGIVPDIEVDLDPSMKGLPIEDIDQEEDAQLWAALDEVRAQADALEEE